MNYPQPPQDDTGSHPVAPPEQTPPGQTPPGQHMFPQPGSGPFPYSASPYPQQPPPGAGPPPAGWEPSPEYWGYAPFPPAGPPHRPGTVLAAAIMTYVGAGLLILFGLVFAIGSANADFLEDFAEAAGTQDLAAEALAGAGISVAVLGIVLVILAVFAQRGRNGARIALTVIGGGFLVLQLVSIATAGLQGLLGFVWIATATTLFWIGGANAWYRQVRL